MGDEDELCFLYSTTMIGELAGRSSEPVADVTSKVSSSQKNLME